MHQVDGWLIPTNKFFKRSEDNLKASPPGRDSHTTNKQFAKLCKLKRKMFEQRRNPMSPGLQFLYLLEVKHEIVAWYNENTISIGACETSSNDLAMALSKQLFRFARFCPRYPKAKKLVWWFGVPEGFKGKTEDEKQCQ